MSDLWAWPTSRAGHEAKSRLMCELAAGYGRVVENYPEPAHPIEIFTETESEIERLARELSAEHTPGETIPFLGALVAASPVDHALHDAYGNALGESSYDALDSKHVGWDLSRYLGAEFKGAWPADFLRDTYAPKLAVFHLVGGLDKLHESEVTADDPDDGFPNSLEAWIARDGVYSLKVKLRGNDLDWDVGRTLEVSRAYHDARGAGASVPEMARLTADTNELCESPDYMIEYLEKVREAEPHVFDEIAYIEQPTERDLERSRFDMRPLARLKPVLVDESLTHLADFDLAAELGWSGLALKSCKCLSADLLFLAKAARADMSVAVQDLTNPSIALVESVGFAARIPALLGFEANSRQFFPAANRPEEAVHPDIFVVREGAVGTSSIGPTGLGLRTDEIDRDYFREP
jgi:L-alanine-DL-glutamate epimerase-like enolase superfamily enzyme